MYFDKLIGWFQRLEPLRRKQLMIFGGGGAILVLSSLFIMATSEEPQTGFAPKQRKIEYTLFNGKSPRDISIDGMAGKIKKLTDDFNGIRATFQLQDEKIRATTDLIKSQTETIKAQNEKLTQQTADLYLKLSEAQEALKNQVPLPVIGSDGSKNQRSKNYSKKGGFDDPELLSGSQLPVEEVATSEIETTGTSTPSRLKIRVVTVSGEGVPTQSNSVTKGKDSKSRKINEYVTIKNKSAGGVQEIFLPAGSILSGTLITGLDAPTSNQSREDPFPALLRIKHEAILPNRYRMDIRECFLIASGYGDLSSERAYMRAERISCVKKDGVIIETALDAVAVGEDGKAGIRGRLVSKNGQIIANSLLAGFVSGISDAFAPQRVRSVQTGTPGGQIPFQYPSPEMMAGQAVMGGVKGSAEQIANYYLEMAKNIFPIIEVDAARNVDFIVVRGTSLNPKSKSSQSNINNNSGVRGLRNEKKTNNSALSPFINMDRTNNSFNTQTYTDTNRDYDEN